jgi:NAD+ kinase
MVPFSQLGDALIEVAAGRMPIEDRSVLRGEIVSLTGQRQGWMALNDIVVSKVEVDKIRADGVIISSPTGSTAYNLSAGGPFVHPTLNLMLLTPICAHSLFTKPLVLPPDDQLEIRGLQGSYPLAVSFDGVFRCRMDPGDRLEITSSGKMLKVYTPANYDFYQVLRQKFQHGYVYGDEEN